MHTSIANEEALSSMLSPVPSREKMLPAILNVAESAGTNDPIFGEIRQSSNLTISFGTGTILQMISD